MKKWLLLIALTIFLTGCGQKDVTLDSYLSADKDFDYLRLILVIENQTEETIESEIYTDLEDSWLKEIIGENVEISRSGNIVEDPGEYKLLPERFTRITYKYDIVQTVDEKELKRKIYYIPSKLVFNLMEKY